MGNDIKTKKFEKYTTLNTFQVNNSNIQNETCPKLI